MRTQSLILGIVIVVNIALLLDLMLFFNDRMSAYPFAIACSLVATSAALVLIQEINVPR